MNLEKNVGYAFSIIITLLIVFAIFFYTYNDDIEQEYFTNFKILDEKIRNM